MSNLNRDNSVVLSRRNLLVATAATAAAVAAVAVSTEQAHADDAQPDVSKLPRVKQKLVAPPFLPEHEQVATSGPKIVEVTLTIEEKKIVIDNEGTEIWALAYDG